MDAIKKRTALWFYSLTVAMTIAIALGVSALHFEAGVPLPPANADRTALLLPSGSKSVALPIGKFIFMILGIIFAAIVLVAILRAAVGLDRKAVLRFLAKSLVAVVAFTLFLLILFSLFPDAALYPPHSEVEHPPPTVSIYDYSPPSPPPKALVWIVGGAIAALAAILGLRILTKKDSREGLEEIELEARTARLALLEGKDLKDVIIVCYRRMSVALAKKSGVERSQSMTAREFEELLEKEGVPRENVHSLTLLFEAVRYGGRSPTPDEEREAIGCLEGIEQYLKRGKSA